jgi:hypothetical protein
VPPEIAHLCENAPRGNGYALRFVQLPAMPIATNCHRPSRLLVDQTWLADGEEIHRDEVLAHKKKPGAWEPGKPPSEQGGEEHC